jgi:Lon protease-like protein
MDTVYLFPLNQSLTLKKIPLPYHIFEPKYKKMVNDAIAMNKRIVVIPSLDNYRNQVCVSGIPVLLQKYDDGRMDIVITGVEKIILKECVKDNPYLEYSYEPVTENCLVTQNEDYQLIKELLWNKLKKQPQFELQKDQFKKILIDKETVINYANLLLVQDINDKISIMRLISLDEKIKMLIKILSPDKIEIGDILNLDINLKD